MCSCSEMIGTSGSSAADSARYGISASVTMAATAGYRPARGPWRISCAHPCSSRLCADGAPGSGRWSGGSGQARVPATSIRRALFPPGRWFASNGDDYLNDIGGRPTGRGAALTAVPSYRRGVFVEQPKRFVERLGRQEQRHLSEAQVLGGTPVVGIGGSAELRQRDVVAGAVTDLVDAFGQISPLGAGWKSSPPRAGSPA